MKLNQTWWLTGEQLLSLLRVDCASAKNHQYNVPPVYHPLCKLSWAELLPSAAVPTRHTAAAQWPNMTPCSCFCVSVCVFLSELQFKGDDACTGACVHVLYVRSPTRSCFQRPVIRWRLTHRTRVTNVLQSKSGNMSSGEPGVDKNVFMSWHIIYVI